MIKLKYENVGTGQFHYYHLSAVIKTTNQSYFRKLPDHVDPKGKSKLGFAWDSSNRKWCLDKARRLKKDPNVVSLTLFAVHG